MFTHFDTILEFDRQVDGRRTNTARRHSVARKNRPTFAKVMFNTRVACFLLTVYIGCITLSA